MKTETNFSYLIRIEVGINNFSIIIRNSKKVPEILLETIAKEKITSFINKNYTSYKHYRTQSPEGFFNKMIKESNYEIEDLNEIEIYDLQLTFNQDKIINKLDGQTTETRESAFDRN